MLAILALLAGLAGCDIDWKVRAQRGLPASTDTGEYRVVELQGGW